jgi:hypothetical protein
LARIVLDLTHLGGSAIPGREAVADHGGDVLVVTLHVQGAALLFVLHVEPEDLDRVVRRGLTLRQDRDLDLGVAVPAAAEPVELREGRVELVDRDRAGQEPRVPRDD